MTHSCLFVRPLLTIALVAGLGACSTAPELPCPRVNVLADAATVTKFRDSPGRDLTDVTAEGEIADTLAECRYDRQAVNVDLQIAIAAQRGPADRNRAAEFDYFVAITDPQQNILAKEVFRVRLPFDDNRGRVGQVEEIEQRIPLASLSRGPDYQILVGFQLTPEEIEWNRRRRGN